MDLRISGVYNAYNAYPVKKVAPPAARKGKDGGDSVSVSPTANEYHVAHKAISELPDVRAAQVSQLQARLQAGTYHVTGAEVAAKIFAE